MLQLAFMTVTRKIITIVIEGKTITYHEDSWGKIFPEGIQFMPKDQHTITKLLRMGGDRNEVGSPAYHAIWIMKENSGESLKEYQKCNSEEELAVIVKKDCESKGLMEVK